MGTKNFQKGGVTKMLELLFVRHTFRRRANKDICRRIVRETKDFRSYEVAKSQIVRRHSEEAKYVIEKQLNIFFDNSRTLI